MQFNIYFNNPSPFQPSCILATPSFLYPYTTPFAFTPSKFDPYMYLTPTPSILTLVEEEYLRL